MVKRHFLLAEGQDSLAVVCELFILFHDLGFDLVIHRKDLSFVVDATAHSKYSVGGSFAADHDAAGHFVDRDLVLILTVERNFQFNGGSSNFGLHDGALVAEFSQTLGVVGLDEFDDSGFGSTAGALEVFVGLIVQIHRHVREVEGDFFLVDDFDGVQVGVGTQTADGDHLLESVVFLELLVN